MASTSTIIWLGILFGALPLAAGILLGRYLPWGAGRSRAESLEAGRLVKLARQLQELVAGLSGQLDQPQTRELQDQLLLAQEQLDEQARQIQSSANLARTDPLTALANRRAFDDELVRRITEWRRRGAGFCLLMIDVDHFKALNDRYGHVSGDQVLRGLGELLTGLRRPDDLPARLGGEEFAVLLATTSAAQAGRIAVEILAAVAGRPFAIEEATIHITVSLGLSMVQPGDGPLTLLRRADDALYASKRGGRNCGHFHNGEICQPILAAQTPAAVPDGQSLPGKPRSSKDTDAELHLLVDDLRTQLKELGVRS
jgi:diguanylate cyclase (GGDEF)-like protein